MFDFQKAIADLVRHPSVSTDPAFAEGMLAARDELAALFTGLGLVVEIVPTERHPVLLARRTGPDSWPHVVIYGHYDVQPPDPLDQWESPPFEPTFRKGRLYGRGAADNKGPMMVHIAAVAELLEAHKDLPLRITFLIEGEEEIGSPSLPAVLQQYQDSLRGDFILLSDTLSPSNEQVAITTSLRGMVSMEVVVDGPRVDLHSGMFGGAVLNPIKVLADLCSSLHDAEGHVAVPGFYEGIQTPAQWERDEIRRLPESEESIARFCGVPATWSIPGRTAMESPRLDPTLEFNGIWGGYMGKGDKTIVPARAGVKISCRLIADQDPERIEQLIRQTLTERCPPEVRLSFTKGHSGLPYSVVPPDRPNTPPDQNPQLANAFRAAHAAVDEIFGMPPLYLREGGSIPIIGTLKNRLNMDSLMLAMGTPENNLHSPNESVDLAMLAKGIKVSRRILSSFIS